MRPEIYVTQFCFCLPHPLASGLEQGLRVLHVSPRVTLEIAIRTCFRYISNHGPYVRLLDFCTNICVFNGAISTTTNQLSVNVLQRNFSSNFTRIPFVQLSVLQDELLLLLKQLSNCCFKIDHKQSTIFLIRINKTLFQTKILL